jgi:PTS system mannose-specific IIA component
MVGAILLTHAFIARELIATTEYIVGKIEGTVAVSIDFKMEAIEARKIISTAIKQVDQGQGVLVLTDLFGGSPSTIAFSFLAKQKVEVVTGANLPMILTFWTRREGMGLRELARTVQLSGTRSIARAKDLIETQGASRKGMPVASIQRR